MHQHYFHMRGLNHYQKGKYSLRILRQSNDGYFLESYHDDYTLKDPNGPHLMESDNFSHGRLEVGPDLNKRSVPRIPDEDDDATEELDMV